MRRPPWARRGVGGRAQEEAAPLGEGFYDFDACVSAKEDAREERRPEQRPSGDLGEPGEEPVVRLVVAPVVVVDDDRQQIRRGTGEGGEHEPGRQPVKVQAATVPAGHEEVVPDEAEDSIGEEAQGEGDVPASLRRGNVVGRVLPHGFVPVAAAPLRNRITAKTNRTSTTSSVRNGGA